MLHFLLYVRRTVDQFALYNCKGFFSYKTLKFISSENLSLCCILQAEVEETFSFIKWEIYALEGQPN